CYNLFNRTLNAYPTRRSSDLGALKVPPSSTACTFSAWPSAKMLAVMTTRSTPAASAASNRLAVPVTLDSHTRAASRRRKLMAPRSEEHTSELQSRENLVCRLL